MILWPEKASIHKIAECGFFLTLGVQLKQLSKINWTFKIAVLVGINEKHEYQHNAIKKSENRMYVTCGNSKFAILFQHTWYILYFFIIFLIRNQFYDFADVPEIVNPTVCLSAKLHFTIAEEVLIIIDCSFLLERENRFNQDDHSNIDKVKVK